ncbi:hypothetical protein [Rheinheimera sp.]|uniref:hypothetical protein n=1 Tax=Rheinheimera sp. TaxID=1869214 RepID=UPI003D285088
MAIYAVIGSDDPEKLGEHLINKFGSSEVLSISNGQWLLSTQQTTNEVFAHIGEDGENGDFLLFPVKHYAGFQEASVWEWLESKESK